MKTFDEIVNDIKKSNPNLVDNLKSIQVEWDGRPIFNDENLLQLKEQLRKIYERYNK